MAFGGVLLGYGSRPGDVMVDSEALSRAKSFFLLSANGPTEVLAASIPRVQ
jgi:hypothetical protein